MPPEDAPAPKRRRVDEPTSANAEARLLRRGIASLHRSVSPPARRQTALRAEPKSEAHATEELSSTTVAPEKESGQQTRSTQEIVPSPFQLTRIRDLPSSANVDTVNIDDVLQDPLITETWVFNYMFDVDWLMSCLDDDTRALTKVKVIHGNWKREDPQKLRMEAWTQQYPNLEVITAYMPEPYGTHHSKMLINFRADETAQVIIHTANMIPQDWANMSQAVWRSPLLPLLPGSTSASSQNHPIGSGERFGSDLYAYLSAYGAKLRPLATRIALHDFSSVRAALVASVPGRMKLNECDPAKKTAWGWVGLQQVLAARSGDVVQGKGKGKTEGMVVAQVSSIASLGATDRWLQHFHTVLSTPVSAMEESRPHLRIIFPTPHEIRRSLDGYASGGSIHTKTQANATQKKQAEYLRPYLCRWDSTTTASAAERRVWGDAKRGTAAPHVKTYVRFSRRVDEPNSEDATVDWALLTSANLSTQAWGAMATEPSGSMSKKKKASQRDDDADGASSGGEVRICSWEVGVCVWPVMFAAPASALGISAPSTSTTTPAPGSSPGAVMTPVFGSDRPVVERKLGDGQSKVPEPVKVGLRLPYSLPLKPYERDDEMWCATQPYQEVDRFGRVWGGF
ncbi:putative tyrosyl-DNA phosphodiesterase [Phyllosticta capitalensis]|uniref:Tyrosyl-DNA phosphodiesterase n=1 Tax=Phyllosticta capitalensis TaxID=121624 RepID=A0ABR1Z0M7_9PEZI